jgi:hypothetical protein
MPDREAKKCGNVERRAKHVPAGVCQDRLPYNESFMSWYTPLYKIVKQIVILIC